MIEDNKKDYWRIERCFFQANMIKGGRYLDDAGKIINDYEEYYEEFEVGPSGLVFKSSKTNDMPDELSINIQRIWTAYYNEESLKRAVEQAPKITKNICKHIDVSLFKRLGLRTVFFKATKEIENYQKKLYSILSSNELQAGVGKANAISEINTLFRVNLEHTEYIIRFQPIIVNREPRSKADFIENGMVVDIDFEMTPMTYKNKVSINNLGEFAEQASKQISLVFRDVLTSVLNKCEETK